MFFLGLSFSFVTQSSNGNKMCFDLVSGNDVCSISISEKDMITIFVQFRNV